VFAYDIARACCKDVGRSEFAPRHTVPRLTRTATGASVSTLAVSAVKVCAGNFCPSSVARSLMMKKLASANALLSVFAGRIAQIEKDLAGGTRSFDLCRNFVDAAAVSEPGLR